MAACPFLTGVATFRCLARSSFVIPSITEETRYCLSKHPERCPHYTCVGAEQADAGSDRRGSCPAGRLGRNARPQ
jgi:hypothetical protein